ncbi:MULTISPECIES: siderophore-interacting protein [unclassified Rhodococcus (in: high G+C Gram-positive bacteria)]|uniref:siderophore-interacting protein n=1 Tax=unclassified Rhodococcus (in: high G+C Gram-positive bacteria) TaxID=192944 RepID=UPI00163AAE33|nr:MULTISPECIES: siderophore-interacting protein [unclassified Rhodococcus (in: high G+C Gram-positive bacteria)]MBC2643758.1 siderophore-interacting protein [Rhodococcus sp. 3A]MBC2891501.1 siderophore-interacting protein [Rhodococcus sp. 4CII]
MAKPTATLTVIRTEWLTPHMVRVILGDPGFDSFVPNAFTDAYAKLEFGSPGEPVLRTYTIRSVDPAAREVAIDFVVHGDAGVAGPWAASAAAGDVLRLRGPGGAFAPDRDVDWYLLAGDETAIPAISAAVEKLDASAVGRVIIEVAGPEDEIAFDSPAGVDVTWIHRGDTADRAGEEVSGDNAPLVAAVRDISWLPGTVQVFIHGEAQAVMHNLRSYVRKERGVPASAASISGYWRRGRTEEGFRVWKSELAASEGASR